MNKMQNDNSINQSVFTRNFNRYLSNSGKKQVEVAKAVKVSTGTICDWKSGRSYPRMDKIQLLADFFGIQKSDLVEDVNIVKETVSEKDQKVLDLFHEVPLNKRDAAIEMLEPVLKTLSKL